MGLTEEQLNAYVDGELDVKTAAHVAHVAARDRIVADRIAELTELKALLPSVLPPMPNVEIPPSISDQIQPKSRFIGRGASLNSFVAAIVISAIVISAASIFYAWSSRRDASAFQLALENHKSWVTHRGSQDHSASHSKTVVSHTSGGVLKIPDLSSAGLTLDAIGQLQINESGWVRLSYVGTRGCRVSLFVAEHANGIDVPVAREPGLRVAAWAIDFQQYLLLASGMDISRFETLVAALRAFSEDLQPFKERTRQLLASSRANSEPCRA